MTALDPKPIGQKCFLSICKRYLTTGKPEHLNFEKNNCTVNTAVRDHFGPDHN